MTVFVSGATGVFGHRIVDRLAAAGYDVLGLTRERSGAAIIEANGGEPVRADLLDSAELDDALAGYDIDVVVHAATRLPPETKTTAEYWERNGRVRRAGARNLLGAVGDTLDQFLFPSVVWVARQPDGSAFDETATRHPDRSTQSAADVEDLLAEASERHALDATILRTGFFYGPDGRHTRLFAENLLAGGAVAKLLIFGAAAAFALGSVLTRRVEAELPIETMEAWSMVGGALIMHVVSLGMGESIADVVWTVESLAALTYLSVVASALGFLIYFDLLERLGAIEINLVSYVAPISAALAGWAVLGEVPTVYTVVGFLVIFVGFLLLKRRAIRAEVPQLRKMVSRP